MTEITLAEVERDLGDLSEAMSTARGNWAAALLELSCDLDRVTAKIEHADRVVLMMQFLRVSGFLTSRMGELHGQCDSVRGGFDYAVFKLEERAKAVEAERAAERENLQTQIYSLQEKLNGRETHLITNQFVRQRVFDLANGKCHYCDVEITFSRDDTCPERCFHVDHIVARSIGGSDHFHNFIASCQRCNCEKGDRSFAEFIARKKRPDLRIVASAEASA